MYKNESGQYQTGTNLTKSEEQERVYYTERGVMEICRWSRQPKAKPLHGLGMGYCRKIPTQ